MKQLKLRTLIIGVVVATFFLTMLINLLSAYRINTEILTGNSLETNRVYAQKLATTADRYIEETFTTLEFSANFVAENLSNEVLLATEAERLRTQNNMFNSVLVADKNGLVIAVSPPSLELRGQTLTSQGPLEAMERKEPMISMPYEGMTGRLLIFISHPIYNAMGDYVGLIGGTIYIKEDNVFHSLLGQHYYDDGSYVYVVDSDGRIIYHADPARLNDVVADNPVVAKVMNGESGAQAVVNSKGADMLAGYSLIKHANWGVVSQRPTESALAPISKILNNLILYALPLLVVAMLAVLWMAVKIANPLNQMARITARGTEKKTVDELHEVPAWYFETGTLKGTLIVTLTALHNQVSFFKTQSVIDPLTGLTNRRTMDDVLDRWTNEKVPFAVLLIDLDHFKSVNDTFGHGVGDEVLKYLAEKIKYHANEDAVCCRFGGEEFMMIMPNIVEAEALQIAESLRQDLARTNSPSGQPVTMSGGIALFPDMASSPAEIIGKADTALYEAKQSGRNRVVVSGIPLENM